MPVPEPILAERTAMQTKSLRELVREASRFLAQAGVEGPERDARLLAAAAIGCSPAELIARPDRVVDEAACRCLAELVQRRCAREPVSRILGSREFYGRSFALSPATLDPRPDSETLIETALTLVEAKGWRERPLRILDVGTGSGCLLLTLLGELPHATGVGTDIAQLALDIAAVNARNCDISGAIERRCAFLRTNALEGIEGPFDLLVCNPPYIRSGDIAGLEPEVRAFDPPAALDGGPDGLHIIRQVIPALTRVVPCGFAIFEVGAGQAEAITGMLGSSMGLSRQGGVDRHVDLGGHTRCVSMEIQL
jgi:release factor glutamine methyltransferase